MSVIVRKRHVWSEPWNSPRYNVTLNAGASAVMVDVWTHGGVGFLTDLGVLWVPAGTNGQLFYYDWIIDGELRERILRIVGTGNISDTPLTGVPFPQHFDPPLTFHRRMQIIAYNNDSQSHMAETYVGGFTVRRRPDE